VTDPERDPIDEGGPVYDEDDDYSVWEDCYCDMCVWYPGDDDPFAEEDDEDGADPISGDEGESG
jgi:hypothetical protein